MSFKASQKRVQIHDISPEIVERLNKKITSLRNGKIPGNGPIDKIPKYDWSKDPKGYRDPETNRMPFDRCYHCGYQYNMANGFTAFCNICTKAMKYTEGGVLTQLEQQRTRVPDGKKAVSLLEGNRL